MNIEAWVVIQKYLDPRIQTLKQDTFILPMFNKVRIAVHRNALLIAVSILALIACVTPWPKVETTAPALIVNDVTLLNPITVARVLTPTTSDEIAQSVREFDGPISIGGARFSKGGQIATESSLHIDMRQFNKILEFSAADKKIRVQVGATWRQILEHIDPHHLSVKIMQTYANFTVGGSLSVNAHGRYVGLGPVILSVLSIKVVLANGTILEANPTRNADLFYGVIGGYGGLGVITEAELELANNVRLKRTHQVMPIAQYRNYFFDNVRQSSSTVFHNADIYPEEYDTVNAISYVVTDDPLTIATCRSAMLKSVAWVVRYTAWNTENNKLKQVHSLVVHIALTCSRSFSSRRQPYVRSRLHFCIGDDVYTGCAAILAALCVLEARAPSVTRHHVRQSENFVILL